MDSNFISLRSKGTPIFLIRATRIFSTLRITSTKSRLNPALSMLLSAVSAHLYGSGRRTRTLDILIAPLVMGNQSFLLNDLFDRNSSTLTYTVPNRHGHIVVTTGNVGVPINFIDCVNNIFDFPDLVAPTLWLREISSETN
jgi:hypothetical protein